MRAVRWGFPPSRWVVRESRQPSRTSTSLPLSPEGFLSAPRGGASDRLAFTPTWAPFPGPSAPPPIRNAHSTPSCLMERDPPIWACLPRPPPGLHYIVRFRLTLFRTGLHSIAQQQHPAPSRDRENSFFLTLLPSLLFSHLQVPALLPRAQLHSLLETPGDLWSRTNNARPAAARCFASAGECPRV